MADHKNPSVVKVLILTWPNLISLLRIFSVPVIIWLILSQEMVWALGVTVIAGLTDALDGLIARLLKTPSQVGAYLDPIADKVLLVSLYLTLGFKNYIYDWLVILIVFRDLLILTGALFLLLMKNNTLSIRPLGISKLNTFLQITGIVWILSELAFGVFIPFITPILIVLIAMTTILSGISYVILWLRYIS